jgi:hypothetical protein
MDMFLRAARPVRSVTSFYGARVRILREIIISRLGRNVLSVQLPFAIMPGMCPKLSLCGQTRGIQQLSSKVTTIIVIDDATLQIRITLHYRALPLPFFNHV